MCLNPKKITSHGNYKEDTYKGKKGEEYYIETFTKCSRCSQCIAEKSNNWVIRNNYESKAHKKICFITLTYEKTLPFLVKKDFQDWLKRFRRYLEYHKLMPIKEYITKINKNGKITQKPIYENIRYFGCGEYGTLYHRPHGHFIIYNWEEKSENLKFLEINKKGNIVLQSKIIQKTWGLGRTTYQIFNANEIPYISLYNTPSENLFKGYILTKEKCNELREKYRKLYEEDNEQRKKLKMEMNKTKDKQSKKKIAIKINIIDKNQYRLKMLKNEIIENWKILDKEKAKSMLIREFNMWSIGLGWKEFKKVFDRYKDNYDWQEYIEDKIFLTPSPWVKKLANMGEEHAIKEMLLRTQELISRGNDYDLESENRLKKAYQNTKKVIDMNSSIDKIIM